MMISSRSAFICILFHIGMSTTIASAQGLHNCTEIDLGNIELNVNVGWPFLIDCDILIRAEAYTVYYDVTYYDYFDGDDILICQVYNLENSTLLMNTSITSSNLLSDDYTPVFIDDVNINETYRFQTKLIFLRKGKCYTNRVTLFPTAFEQVTCEEYLQRNLRKASFPSDTESFRRFSCTVPPEEHWNVIAINQRYNITSTWLRNCSHLPSNLSINSGHELLFPSVTFDHAGVYTCAISYNGMTRYIQQKQVCVKHHPSLVQHSIKCAENVVYVTKGESNATLECTMRLGRGQFSDLHFFIFWEKLSSNANNSEAPFRFCRSSASSSLSSSSIFCYYKYKRNNERECSLHVASEKERTRSDEFVSIFLEFRNVSSSDFGKYEVTATSVLTTSMPARDTVSLRERPRIIHNGANSDESAKITMGVVCCCLIIIETFTLTFF